MTSRLLRGDPRIRILLVIFATTIIASTTPGVLLPFAAYFPLCIALLVMQRVPVSYLAWRCAAASFFILLASALLAYQAGIPAALSVAAKAYAAVLLLSFLTDSTSLPDLLTGLRRLRSPEALNLILGMMYRYTSLLSEEYARMERARESRTVMPPSLLQFDAYGHRIGALILRSWDRAERVHEAMISRGFTGVWPAAEWPSFGWRDVALVCSITSLFLIARFVL